jgi:hypothetical protein
MKYVNRRRTGIEEEASEVLHLVIALYGAETWTLPAVDEKHVDSLNRGAGEGWKRSFGLIM